MYLRLTLLRPGTSPHRDIQTVRERELLPPGYSHSTTAVAYGHKATPSTQKLASELRVLRANLFQVSIIDEVFVVS